MATPFAGQIEQYLRIRHSPLAPYASVIAQQSQRYGHQYHVDPVRLAAYVIGISGGEQTWGNSGAPDVRLNNLWGFAHPPNAASGKMFPNLGAGATKVAETLARDYLSQGLVNPQQVYGRWVKGDPYSVAKQGGYTADWINTVKGTLGAFGIAATLATAPAAPAATGSTAPLPRMPRPGIPANVLGLLNANNRLIGLPQLTPFLIGRLAQSAASSPMSTPVSRTSSPVSPKPVGQTPFSVISTKGIVYPVPRGVKPEWFRTDSGKDFRVKAGTPLLAMGPGEVVYAGDGGGYGPNWVIYKVTAGPLKGKAIFIGHSKFAPGVKVGMQFAAGTPLAIAAGIGSGGAPLNVGPGWVEMGFAENRGEGWYTQAHYTGRDASSHYSSAGENFWTLLKRLQK